LNEKCWRAKLLLRECRLLLESVAEASSSCEEVAVAAKLAKLVSPLSLSMLPCSLIFNRRQD
jgi:hypothetical protein